MNKIKLCILTLVCSLVVVACSSETAELMDNHSGTGKFCLTMAAGDITTEVTTRALASTDVSTFLVTLKDANAITLIDGKTYGTLSEGDRTLPTGNGYAMSVESCTPEEATTLNSGWGSARFAANTTFNIVSGKTTELALTCEMQNAGLQLVFDPSFTEKFPIHAATTQDSRMLVFKNTNADAIAFYNVDDIDSPKVTLRLTGSKGGWDDRIDKTSDIGLTAGKIKILTVKYDENSGDLDLDFETDTDIETDDNNVTIQ